MANFTIIIIIIIDSQSYYNLLLIAYYYYGYFDLKQIQYINALLVLALLAGLTYPIRSRPFLQPFYLSLL